jgi:hypothetical protein
MAPHIDPELEKLVESRLMKLNAAATGIATGLLLGVGLFVATLWLVIKGGEVIGPHLGLLGQYLIGYSVTYVGSVVGLVYGFVIGFIGGYSVAAIYNFILHLRSGR